MTALPHPLELRSLSKSFGRVQVLRNVDLNVQSGEIHALVGQNGSGKSTLVKVLAGLYTPDSGSQILVAGRALNSPTRSRDLRQAGISIVHQDLGLVPTKSVAENIAVGSFQAHRWTKRIDWRHEQRVAAELLERLDAGSVRPDALVSELSPAERSLVAIARALRNQRPDGGVIVLDEATKALPKDALEEFYRALRQVVRTGGAALMISHNLEEVMLLSDRVTVLRDGAVAGTTLTTARTNEQEVARLMLGRDVTRRVHRRPALAERDNPIEVRGLSGAVIRDAGFQVRPGEILGVSGVVGSGWDELPYLLTGARRASAGSLTVGGRILRLDRTTPGECIAAGVALVPENRIDDGLALGLTVTENVTLPRVRRRGSRWWIGDRWQREETTEVIDTLDVRPKDPARMVGQFSGGNQQKVLLGKWLAGAPHLLVLHEPTQAVDVGAREDILLAISQTAERGIGVVLCSVQASDLTAVCDRVLIFSGGRIIDELIGPDDEDTVIDAIYGGHLSLPTGKG